MHHELLRLYGHRTCRREALRGLWPRRQGKVAVIVLWAGVTSLQESVGRIVNPEEASYDVVKGAYDLAQGDSNIIEVHGFYVDEDAKYASFDLVISFDAPD